MPTDEQPTVIELGRDLNAKDAQDIQNGVMPRPNQVYFSLFSGQIYSIEPDMEVDAFQIPLTGKPHKHYNCSKCYGRLHLGYDLKNKHYIVCRKCLKKFLDVPKLQELNKKKAKA